MYAQKQVVCLPYSLPGSSVRSFPIRSCQLPWLTDVLSDDQRREGVSHLLLCEWVLILPFPPNWGPPMKS